MRHLYLLLSCFLADFAVSTSSRVEDSWNLSGDGPGAELVRRASLKRPTESRRPRRPPVASSSSSNQASSSQSTQTQGSIHHWLQSQASSGQVPTRQSYDIYLPIGGGSSGDSDSNRSPSPPARTGSPKSGSPRTNPGSPTSEFSRSSPQARSRDASPYPPTNRPSAIRSSDAARYFGMTAGPMPLPRAQQSRRIAATRPRQIIESTVERSPSPPRPPIPNIISGHPNSAIVVVRGPGWLQVQKSNGVSEIANVAPGQWDYISQQDRQGLFAVGRSMGDGYAVAATTGNAAAGYVAVGEGGRGYVETHDGPSFSYTNVGQGREFRKPVRGDDTGSVKGAALAVIEGHGQVTAVAMHREVAQPDL